MSTVSESLLRGAREALSHALGEKTKCKTHKVKIPQKIDVREIRTRLHLSRSEFANKYGFSIRTVEKWEQHTREPDGAARAYLAVISKNHKAVESALKSYLF